MLSKLKNTAALICFLSLVMTTNGCVALLFGAAAGAGGYAWAKGVLEKEFDRPVEEVHAAVLKALKKLEITVKDEDKDRLSAVTKGKFADGKNLTVHIEAVTEKKSKLKIRVGVFGDRDRSEQILNLVKKSL